MTQGDTFKRYLDAGMALGQMTRDRAEAIVRELVKAGEVQREHAQERVEELVERGRKGSDALIETVRKEVAKQLAAMGVATKQDLAALEARLAASPEPSPPADDAAPSAPEKPVDEPGSG